MGIHVALVLIQVTMLSDTTTCVWAHAESTVDTATV